MENIAEAQVDPVENLPDESIQNDPNTENEVNDEYDDEFNVSYTIIFTHLNVVFNSILFLFQELNDRKVGFNVEKTVENDTDERNYSENDDCEKKEPLKLHRRLEQNIIQR